MISFNKRQRHSHFWRCLQVAQPELQSSSCPPALTPGSVGKSARQGSGRRMIRSDSTSLCIHCFTLHPLLCWFVYRIGNYGQCQTLHLVCCTYWHWWNCITWHPHHQTHSFSWKNGWENIANWDTGAPYGRLNTWYKQFFDVYIKYFFKNKQDHSFTKSNTLNLK